MIRILHKRPGMAYPAEVREIESSLLAMQRLVSPDGVASSYIELVRIPELQEKGIDLYVNEEGKFNGCRPSFEIFGGQDMVFGPVFFVSSNDEGESVSLTDEQMETAQAWVKSRIQVIGIGY